MRIISPSNNPEINGDFKITAIVDSVRGDSRIELLDSEGIPLEISQYQIVTMCNLSWNDLHAQSESFVPSLIPEGWNLAFIDNQEEQDYLTKEMNVAFSDFSVSDYYLTGMAQNADRIWLGEDNKNLTYTAWTPNQPAHNTDGVAALGQGNNWRWTSLDKNKIDNVAGYILERNSQLIELPELSSSPVQVDFVIKQRNLRVGLNKLILRVADENSVTASASFTVINLADTHPIITLTTTPPLTSTTIEGTLSLYGDTTLTAFYKSLSPWDIENTNIFPDASGNFTVTIEPHLLTAENNLLTLTATNQKLETTTKQFIFDAPIKNPLITITSIENGGTLTEPLIEGNIYIEGGEFTTLDIQVNNSDSTFYENIEAGTLTFNIDPNQLLPSGNTITIVARTDAGGFYRVVLENLSANFNPSVKISPISQDTGFSFGVYVTGIVRSIYPLSEVRISVDGAAPSQLFTEFTEGPIYNFTIPIDAFSDVAQHSITVIAKSKSNTGIIFEGTTTMNVEIDFPMFSQ